MKKPPIIFEDLSVEAKNKLLTENLFGLKVIYPHEYYAGLKGKNADYWRDQMPESNAPIVVKDNKPLKTHSIDSYPMPNFYEGEHLYELIARARARIEEKSLHLDFVLKVAESFESPDFWEKIHWNLINASPAIQADAMVKVLLEKI